MRARLIDIQQNEPYLIGNVRQMTNCIKGKDEGVETEAVMRAIKTAFKQYCRNMPKMPPELVSSILDETDPELFFEAITYNIALPVEDKQMLLEENYLVSRLGMLLAMISRETEVLDIEHHIREKVRERIDNGQREYYLREQMKVIAAELGEEDNPIDELDDYAERIEKLGLEDESQEKLMREVDRLSKMSPSSQEAYVVRNYLDTILELPWKNYTADKTDVVKARSRTE